MGRDVILRWSRRAVSILLLHGVGTAAAAGQGTTTVAVGDPLYDDLDRLIAAGITPRAVVGQRPYSRREVMLLALGARAVLDSLGFDEPAQLTPLRQSLDRILDRIRDVTLGPDSIRERLPFAPRMDAWTAGALTTDAPSRPFRSNGLGTVEADLNTLTDEREGRPFVAGSNVALEGTFAMTVRRDFSLQAVTRLWAYDPRAAAPDGVDGALLSGHARLLLGNAAVTVGREYTNWSQAGGLSLLLSANAPATDMVRLASDAPFSLPGVLRRLGPLAGTMQIADLGPSAANSHSLLVAYKLTALPTSNVELGATFLNHFGGAGARSSSVAARFFDLAPFIDVFRHHNDSTDLDSDKLIGFDGRLRLRHLGNISLFGEMALEDFDPKRVRGMLTDDAAYIAGVTIPRLGWPSVSSTMGYHRTGLRFYEHHLVTNGLASRRFTLGDDLGRDAEGVFVSTLWERSAALSLGVDGRYESRRNDQYDGLYQPGGATGLTFRRVSTVPAEHRARGVVTLRRWSEFGRHLLELRAGAERTTNFSSDLTPSMVHGVLEVRFTAFR